MKMRSVVRLSALMLALVLTLGAGAAAGAEGTRVCGIRAESTRELYDSLIGTGEWDHRSQETRDRLYQSFPAPSEGAYALSYNLVENVTVDIQGSSVPLDEAVSGGMVSVEALLAAARQDAEAGVSFEFIRTKNGLTEYTYCYPDYNLVFCDDVLETPDGKSHLIRSLQVAAPGTPGTVDTALTDPDSPYRYPIDREEWGLDFQVLAADSGGVTLEITQSGGQQFGQLVLQRGGVYTAGDLDGAQEVCFVELTPAQPLTMEGTTQVTLRWAQPQERGDYLLRLSLHDNFTQQDIPPLSQDFHEYQTYYVEFQIK